jgi:hypothetical protein
VETSDTTSTAASNAPSAAPTPAPTPTPTSPATASQGTANTAPAGSREREALARLRGGESATTINADLNKRAPSTKPTATAPGKEAGATSTQAGKDAGSQPAAGKEPTAEELGIDAKELAALKRGKFDLALLAHMPAANRKAIARGLAASQAEQDRVFQAAKNGKTPAGGTDATAEAGAANPDATQQDEATGDGEKKADGQPTANSTQTEPVQSFGQAFQIPAADLETLADIGGKDFADATSKLFGGLSSHMSGQLNALAGLLGYAMERFETQDFTAALDGLRKNPGFEQVGSNPEDAKALKERATLLVRAAGDPRTYGFEAAVQDAAASLFRVNASQAAQAQLANARNSSLAGSPDRGPGSNKGTRPMSEGDRMKAILSRMRGGDDWRAARSAVETA